MASGATHTFASIAASVPVAAGAAYITRDIGLGLLAGAGCMSGVVLSPDLDIEHKTASERVLWGLSPIIGLPFELAFMPYAWAFPHRSPISHWPVLGTLGRLAYLVVLLVILQLHLRRLGLEFDALFWTRYPRAAFAWAAGLAVSDGLHWVMDGLPT